MSVINTHDVKMNISIIPMEEKPVKEIVFDTFELIRSQECSFSFQRQPIHIHLIFFLSTENKWAIFG